MVTSDQAERISSVVIALFATVLVIGIAAEQYLGHESGMRTALTVAGVLIVVVSAGVSIAVLFFDIVGDD